MQVNCNNLKTKHFEDWAYQIHIPKCGGMSLERNFQNARIGNLGHLPLVAARKRIMDEPLCKKPLLFTWLRDPKKRAISCLRFTKIMANTFAKSGLLPGHGPEMRQYYSDTSVRYFTRLSELSLNNVSDLREIVALMRDHTHIFDSRDVWPFFAYETFFCPPGYEEMEMNDEKVELCVNFALENFDFFGNLDNQKTSLEKFKIASNHNFNTTDTNSHETSPDLIENIDQNNAEIHDFFEEILRFEYLIHNRLLEEECWKVAVPYAKQHGEETDYTITQYTLPKDFDPDAYFTEHAGDNLGHLDDIWKKREWAMLHYVSREEQLDPAVFYEFQKEQFQDVESINSLGDDTESVSSDDTESVSSDDSESVCSDKPED